MHPKKLMRDAGTFSIRSSTFHEVYVRFRGGRKSVWDKICSGRPPTSVSDENIEKGAAIEWSWPRTRGRHCRIVGLSSDATEDSPPCRGADARKICRCSMCPYVELVFGYSGVILFT
ncbi:hypothetical protein TNCV_4124801 [Trichonephila clavipes]|nr:hypothetical protein TNCV_4124801 [Trichonephila clavipes]